MSKALELSDLEEQDKIKKIENEIIDVEIDDKCKKVYDTFAYECESNQSLDYGKNLSIDCSSMISHGGKNYRTDVIYGQKSELMKKRHGGIITPYYIGIEYKHRQRLSNSNSRPNSRSHLKNQSEIQGQELSQIN